MTPAYSPHEAYAAAARPSCDPLRLVLGIAVVEALFAVGMKSFDHVIGWISPTLADDLYFGDTAIGLLVQLLSYGWLGVAVLAVLGWLHGRGWRTLIGPQVAQMLPRAFAGAVAFYLCIQILPPWVDFQTAEGGLGLMSWLALLPFGLAALLVQTGAEEMFYRGYIQQQLAARFHNPMIWMVVPNLLFACVHWQAGAGWAENWQYVIWAFCFGLAVSDLTARSGNLGPAIGLHLANNAYAFLIFGDSGGPDSGLALFLFPDVGPLQGSGPDSATGNGAILTLSLLIELVIIALAWLSARIAIRR